MKLSKVARFLTVSILLVLALMPLWYLAAEHLAPFVFNLAGQLMGWLFIWVKGVQVDGAIGTLRTHLSALVPAGVGQFSLGEMAPKADYRLFGYGLALLWALFIASWSRHMLVKLVSGSLIVLLLQSLSLCVQWLNDVLNKAGPEVLMQTGQSRLMQEVVLFLFHFNLFVMTALAPVLIWLSIDKEFVKQLWLEVSSASTQPKSRTGA